ncbi:MAG: ABC transporter ATP-binding protein [Oscillospiraceae bacterium]|nr:ABC transporter ATP-binding protein [Oscillospiraceae bacterium]
MKNFDVLKRILSYTKPYLPFLIVSFIAASISVAMTLYAPVLVGQGIDYIIGKDNVDFDSVLPIVIKLCVVVVLSSLFSWLMTLCTNTVSYNTVNDMRCAVHKKLDTLPLKYIDGNSRGDLISRVTVDIEQVSDGMLQGFSQFFTGIVTIAGTIIFMLSINFKIALVVIFITPLSLFVAAFITKISHDKFKERSSVQGELSGCIEEMIGSQKVVKAFAYEDRAQEKFEEINARLYKCGLKAQFYSALTNPCTRFVNGLVYAATGIFGALSVLSGNGVMTVGQISTFLSYANQYTKPFNEITGVITELQSAFASARRVFAILDEEPEPSDENGIEMADSTGAIEIKNVSFSYVPEKPLIQNLNLSVKPGQRVAIVGPTGCGKTTFINLLMRFYDVTEGEILIDGVNIKDMKRSDLRSLYGMVLQDTWIFTGSVKENIAYGKPDATDEEIKQAAMTAHSHSFIKRLENGYDTMLSEDGGNLSQGQKQLLSISRIMMTDPSMLILDEATSSIDTMTEQRIQRAFAKLMKGRTSFIIAHRLSTIKDADVILVMRDGNIIEQGSHEELIAKNGFYTTLYNSQFEKA